MLLKIPKTFIDKCIDTEPSKYESKLIWTVIMNTWYVNRTSISCDVLKKRFDGDCKEFESLLNGLVEKEFFDVRSNRVHIATPESYENEKELSKHKENMMFMELFKFWNRQPYLIKHTLGTITRNKSEIKGIVKSVGNGDMEVGLKAVNESIKNYNYIFKDDRYWYTHTWTLINFLRRGVDNFISHNKPYERFLKKEKTTKDPAMSEMNYYGQ